jgi:hypothetical protein
MKAQIFNALYPERDPGSKADQTYQQLAQRPRPFSRRRSAEVPPAPRRRGTTSSIAYDAPPIAAKGCRRQRRYAAIAPGRPHALHMPSHIFTRGRRVERIRGDRNRRAADVAKKGMKATSAACEGLHGVCAPQLGRDEVRAHDLRRGDACNRHDPRRLIGPYAMAAMPARLAVERGAARRRPRCSSRRASSRSPKRSTTSSRDRRRRGAATSPRQADVQTIEKRRDALRSAKNDYWADRSRSDAAFRRSVVALAENRAEEALQLMRTAADTEDKNDKHPVTPGRICLRARCSATC